MDFLDGLIDFLAFLVPKFCKLGKSTREFLELLEVFSHNFGTRNAGKSIKDSK